MADCRRGLPRRGFGIGSPGTHGSKTRGRLVIEHIGVGPRGGELVSVAHYGEQAGDLMRDPEIFFEVAAGEWHPVSILQDYVSSYREAVVLSDDGKVFVRPAELRDIQTFARMWDRNLKHQVFVGAAEAKLRR
jgi:hypothetical protein